MSVYVPCCALFHRLTNLYIFLLLRTVAAEVRKQVSRDYGSPQLTKKRGGAHHPVSHPVFNLLEFQASRFKASISEVEKLMGVTL